jgi:hypothetical protein
METCVAENYYQVSLVDRRRLLADLGFIRGVDLIWRHADGRAIGEGVMAAIVDRALCRYLKIDPALVRSANSSTPRRKSRRKQN